MKYFGKTGNEYEVPTDVEIVNMSNRVTGLSAILYFYGNNLAVRITGTTLIALGTSNQYSRIGTSSKIKDLSSDNVPVVKRTYITNNIYGQVVIDKSTGDVKIGYTRSINGETVNIPEGTAIYVSETYVL